MRGEATKTITASQKEVMWAETEDSKGTGKTVTSLKNLTPARQVDTEKDGIDLKSPGSMKHGTLSIEDTTSTGAQEQKHGPSGGSHGQTL